VAENGAEIEELVLHAQEDGGERGEARLVNGELVDVKRAAPRKELSSSTVP